MNQLLLAVIPPQLPKKGQALSLAHGVVQLEGGTRETDLDKQALVDPLVERLGDSPFDIFVLRIEPPVLLWRVWLLSIRVLRVCTGSSERRVGGSKTSPHLEVGKDLPAANSRSAGRTNLSLRLT